ncbi:hypothetical protein BCD48_41790 [Pseudofrankia sp. BMG5.36]|nr:hypothetical protein BCD48_41790 [Pseudofrankia sp. BMG5.36]
MVVAQRPAVRGAEPDGVLVDGGPNLGDLVAPRPASPVPALDVTPAVVDGLGGEGDLDSPTAVKGRAPASTTQVASTNRTGSRCRLPRQFRGSVTCSNTTSRPAGDTDGDRPPATAEAS